MLYIENYSSWCIYYNRWHPYHFIPLFMTVFCFTFLSLFYVNKFSPTYGLQRKKNIENGNKCEIPGYQTVYYIYTKMSMMY